MSGSWVLQTILTTFASTFYVLIVPFRFIYSHTLYLFALFINSSVSLFIITTYVIHSHCSFHFRVICLQVGNMDREDSPDYDGVGYIEEDHPLRPSMAAQSIALLQVPSDRSRHISVASSITDQDVPIFARERIYTPGRQQVNTLFMFFVIQEENT